MLKDAENAAAQSGDQSDANRHGTVRYSVSIIIGIRNWGLDRLRVAIQSHLISENASVQIIISDYGSDNREDVEAIAREFKCTYIYSASPIWSRSRALNAGVTVAKGDIIVGTDADIIFTPATLRVVAERLSQAPHSVHLVQCRDLDQRYDADTVMPFAWDEFFAHSTLRPRWGMGGLAAVRRDLFDAVRGYDERMAVWGAEDNDFVQRVRGTGAPVCWIQEPEVQIYHIWHLPFLQKSISNQVIFDENKKILKNDKSIIRNTGGDSLFRPVSPLVSIVIATFNRSQYLKESIESCLNQTFEDFEIIIMDDGSEDDTRDVVNSFGDARIRYFYSESRRGVAASRNAANAIATGLYIVVHDDDDIMLPNRISLQLSAMEAGDVGSYGGWIDFEGLNLSLQPGKSPFSLASILFNPGVLLHPTVLIRRDVATRYKYFEDFESGSDYNWMARIAASGVILKHTGHVLILRRIHAENMTKYNSSNQKVSSALTGSLILNEMSSEQEKSLRQVGKATRPVDVNLHDLHEQVSASLPSSAFLVKEQDETSRPKLYKVSGETLHPEQENESVFHWHKMKGYAYHLIDLKSFFKTREMAVDFYTSADDRPLSIQDQVMITEHLGPNAAIFRCDGQPVLEGAYFLPEGEKCLIWSDNETHFLAFGFYFDMEMTTKAYKLSKVLNIIEGVCIKSEAAR